MQSNNLRTSESLPAPLLEIRSESARRKALRQTAWWYCAGMLTALVLLLMGCASPPNKQCEMQQLPTPPALSEPIPSVSYSISVGQRIKSWGLSLIGTPATSKP